MRQPLLGGSSTTLATSGTNYFWLSGGGEGSFTDAKYFTAVFPIAGTLTNFQVNLSVAPGVGKSHTFTVMINGSDSALAVTISDAATLSSLDASSVSISAGDYVTLKHTTSGTPTTSFASWGAEFDSGSGGAIIIGGRGDGTDHASSKYTQVCGGGGGWSIATETLNKQVVPTSGTLQNFRMRLSVAPAGVTVRTFTLTKNGSDTAITFNITGAATTGADTSHTVAVTVGDFISLKANQTGTPAPSEYSWGVELDPTTDGESPIMSNFNNAGLEANNATEYAEFGVPGTSDTTENHHNYLATIAFLMRNWYIYTELAQGSGKTLTLSNRINGADGTLTATMSNANSANDTTHSDSISATNLITMKSVPSGTPSIGGTSFGFTAYIAPAASSSTTNMFQLF